MDGIKSINGGLKSLHDDVIFITKDIDKYLLKEGFLREDFDDCYSGAKGSVLFHKRLGFDRHDDRYTAVVTDQYEIAIEREYSYRSGESAGCWRFDKEKEESFVEAYNNLVEKISYLVKEMELKLPE